MKNCLSSTYTLGAFTLFPESHHVNVYHTLPPPPPPFASFLRSPWILTRPLTCVSQAQTGPDTVQSHVGFKVPHGLLGCTSASCLSPHRSGPRSSPRGFEGRGFLGREKPDRTSGFMDTEEMVISDETYRDAITIYEWRITQMSRLSSSR